MSTYEDRLARLRRQGRWIAGVAIASAVVSAVSLARPQSSQAVVTKLVLEDESGTVRARLEVANGKVQLVLSSPNGAEHLILGAASLYAVRVENTGLTSTSLLPGRLKMELDGGLVFSIASNPDDDTVISLGRGYDVRWSVGRGSISVVPISELPKR